MKLQDDDFSLFGLPARFALERSELDGRWKQLQREAHPDRFAAQGSAAQRVAMQWSVRINEAYQRLRDPLRRAAYLCELRGQAEQAERNTAMPPAFLMQQMQWREALEEATDAATIQALHDEVRAAHAQGLHACARLLDDQDDAASAAGQVRALMFIERFLREIEDRLDAEDARMASRSGGQ